MDMNLYEIVCMIHGQGYPWWWYFGLFGKELQYICSNKNFILIDLFAVEVSTIVRDFTCIVVLFG